MTNATNDGEKSWPAPAKINLFLHVVVRRPDGYHLLQTVFQFLDYCDDLQFEPRGDNAIVLATPLPDVPPEKDLTVRAAKALQAAAKQPTGGATISLSKKLPLGGGLGGGSSDAATTLIALNRLWNIGLSRSELCQIGLQLGADVPVFVHGHACFAEGVGEKFSEVILPPTCYLVTVPPVQVPTAEIFGASELCRETPLINASKWQTGQGHNDLEPVAVARYPIIGEHLRWLKRYGDARMSGSGACCYVGFPDKEQAMDAYRNLPVEMSGFVAEGLNRHPLAIAD